MPRGVGTGDICCKQRPRQPRFGVSCRTRIISPKKTLCPFSKGGLAFERGAVRPGRNHAALTSWTPWARPQIRPPPEPPEDGGLRPSAHSQPCPVLPHKQTCPRRTQTSERLIYAFNTASFI